MIEHALAPQEWSYSDENLAMLIDRLDYWLTAEYSSWVTDPDDPEVKKARAERKKSGKKSPPIPLITPVARRPLKHAEAARARVDQLREYWEKPLPAPIKPGQSKIKALDSLLGF